LSDKIVENGKLTSKDSCNLDEKPDELIEEEVKVNENEVSPVWGKRVRRKPVNMSDDFYMVDPQKALNQKTLNFKIFETDVTIFHQNIRGLNISKMDELLISLSQISSHIICLT
jgi:hypothetical protein